MANAQEVSFTLSGSLGESETGGAAINIVPRTGGNRYAGNYFTSYITTRFFDRNREHAPGRDTPDDHRSTTTTTTSTAPSADRSSRTGSGSTRGGQPRRRSLSAGRHDARVREPERGQVRAPTTSPIAKGWLTYSNEYKKANVRLTVQATQKNKFNIYWDEQDSCTNPCYGMINVVDSPEAYCSLQS